MEEGVVWADKRKVMKFGGSHVVSLPEDYFSPGDLVRLRLYENEDGLKLVIEKAPNDKAPSE